MAGGSLRSTLTIHKEHEGTTQWLHYVGRRGTPKAVPERDADQSVNTPAALGLVR